MANKRHGINGRIAVQFILVLLEGIFLIWFSKTTTYNSAVILMVTFSICVQAANGSCFALVPYINCGMGKSVRSLFSAPFQSYKIDRYIRLQHALPFMHQLIFLFSFLLFRPLQEVPQV